MTDRFDEMARQVEDLMQHYFDTCSPGDYYPLRQGFLRLVRQAVAEEREECAKVAESREMWASLRDIGLGDWCPTIASAIRNRT